jgi:hypothetical protein
MITQYLLVVSYVILSAVLGVIISNFHQALVASKASIHNIFCYKCKKIKHAASFFLSTFKSFLGGKCSICQAKWNSSVYISVTFLVVQMSVISVNALTYGLQVPLLIYVVLADFLFLNACTNSSFWEGEVISFMLGVTLIYLYINEMFSLHVVILPAILLIMLIVVEFGMKFFVGDTLLTKVEKRMMALSVMMVPSVSLSSYILFLSVVLFFSSVLWRICLRSVKFSLIPAISFSIILFLTSNELATTVNSILQANN